MRTKIILIASLLLMVVAVQAQPGRHMERIHAIKVAYLTDKLKLTSEESARFWPVYNRFEDERRELLSKYRKEKRTTGVNDDDAMRSIDDDMEMQQKMLDLRKKYNDEFLKVITPQQLATLIESEKEFKKLILQQIKERRGSMDKRRSPMR